MLLELKVNSLSFTPRNDCEAQRSYEESYKWGMLQL
jgi:hypothetical protein